MPRLDEIAERVAGVLRSRRDVLEGYIFGSLARGEAQPHSDVDVAVWVDRATPASPFGPDAEIGADLGSALGTNRVDVTLLNDAGPLLYHRVLRDGIRVFSRDLRATTVREGRALSRYCDYLPQLAKIRAAAERRARIGAFGR
jgi:predicted nucleotidyltransferase